MVNHAHFPAISFVDNRVSLVVLYCGVLAFAFINWFNFQVVSLLYFRYVGLLVVTLLYRKN